MPRYLRVLLCALMLGGCASLSPQKPEVHIADIRPAGNATLFEQAFDMTLRINNPNQQPLSAQGLRFNIKLNGDSFASGVSDQPFEIAPLSSEKVTIRIYTSLTNWLKQLSNVLGSSSALAYQIDGTVISVNGLSNVPFSSKGDWTLPAP